MEAATTIAAPLPLNIANNGETSWPLTGRRRICLKREAVTGENLPCLLAKVLEVHQKNAREIDFLHKYYRGEQRVLQRTKDVRPEICNHIVLNHAHEIVAFKDGYQFGEPVQYVKKGTYGPQPGYTEDNTVAALNEIMATEGKDSKDADLMHAAHICGHGYRMVLPSRAGALLPFRTDVLYPGNTFVVYDTGFGREAWLCGHYEYDNDGRVELAVYTETHYFLCEGTALNTGFTVADTQRHTLGVLPIIEYPANKERLGAFEPVITILDALNDAASNRMDGVEQFIQSFLVFRNCEIDAVGLEALREQGAVNIKGSQGLPADVSYLVSQLDQQQTQTMVDHLYQTMLLIAGVPDRNANASNNTGQALIIGQGWANAESRAKSTELVFKEAERDFLRAVFAIMAKSKVDAALKGLKLADLDIRFNRSKTDNALVKTQSLQNLLEAGVHPRIALAACGMFSDPEQVFTDSVEYLEKWKKAPPNEAEPVSNQNVRDSKAKVG